MIPQSSTSIALEGIGFNDSTLVGLLGFGFIEIYVPPEEIYYPELLAGGFSTKPSIKSRPKNDKNVKLVAVTVKMKIAGKSTTRTYMVRPSKYQMLVTVTNLINNISSGVSIGIQNIKNGYSKMVDVIFKDK